jgi:DNA-binding beta-propeller fold protein YncE
MMKSRVVGVWCSAALLVLVLGIAIASKAMTNPRVVKNAVGSGVGDYLLVPDFDRHVVLRFDAATGAFVDEVVTRKSGGLNQPYIALIGPHDGNLYVSTGHFMGPGQIKGVLRYDGGTGAFMDEFVQRGQIDMGHQLLFGPDGNLYFADRVEGNTARPKGGRILRFNGQTGAFIDVFVSQGSGGLEHPDAHVFGPDGNGDGKMDLYVCDEHTSRILLFDGQTGAFGGDFVTSGSGGLSYPQQLSFGPDGNIYVASGQSILRFQGPSGASPGAPMPSTGNDGAEFVASGSGELLFVSGAIFGPDCNNDGNQDLYVGSIDLPNGFVKARHGSIKRYDGTSGAFIDTFVPKGTGGIDDPMFLTFTKTDPVTLAYTGN